MNKIVLVGLVVIVLPLVALAVYLLRPLPVEPRPAPFVCLDLADGEFQPFVPRPEHIYGVGLAYAGHINETASDFTPGAAPPIFPKLPRTLTGEGAAVRIPASADLIQDLVAFEPGLEAVARERFADLPALLDYETELGFVLLEDVDAGKLRAGDFNPALGFFIGNDLSSRSLAVFGEGTPDRAAYWGVSKSFPGFLPVSDRVWIPRAPVAGGIPCVTIESLVNGQLRQRESTSNMIYTPIDMLRFISEKYPDRPLRRGDMVLMGTPGGVAMSTPRWMARLSDLVGMDRFAKLSAVLRKDRTPFLKNGDTVQVRGEGLGGVTVRIVE